MIVALALEATRNSRCCRLTITHHGLGRMVTLSWPLPAEMTDSALETALFAAAGTKQGHRRHVEPDWAEIHRELSEARRRLGARSNEVKSRLVEPAVALSAIRAEIESSRATP